MRGQETDEEVDWDGTVLSHDGMLWRPAAGCTASAAEFVQARTRIVELHEDAAWSPWVLDDHADEYDQATRIFDQWERAEPGFKYLTREDVEARWAQEDAEREARQREQEAQREHRRAAYDVSQEAARLALLELEAYLTIAQRKAAQLRDGSLYPAMPPERRSVEQAEADALVVERTGEVEALRAEVGNPESVIDSRGRLPSERRALLFTLFKVERQRVVEKLRDKVASLQSELEATRGREGRAAIRDELRFTTYSLEGWIAVPPVTADEMCSECASPGSWHLEGTLGPLGQGPCPAWPRWAARIEHVREMILSLAVRKEGAAQPPKRQPLATIPSGLPAKEIAARLAELSIEHPDAVVRRGKANSWEFWPAETSVQ